MCLWLVAHNAIACMFLPIHSNICSSCAKLPAGSCKLPAHTHDITWPRHSKLEWRNAGLVFGKSGVKQHKHLLARTFNQYFRKFASFYLVCSVCLPGPCISNLAHPCFNSWFECRRSGKRGLVDVNAMFHFEQRSQYIIVCLLHVVAGHFEFWYILMYSFGVWLRYYQFVVGCHRWA